MSLICFVLMFKDFLNYESLMIHFDDVTFVIHLVHPFELRGFHGLEGHYS